jgi:hypothetical protein
MMTMNTTTNERSFLPLQTTMTEAGTIGAKIDITTKGEDVVVDMANEAEEVDEAGVEDMEVNPSDSIPSTTTTTKTTGAVSPGKMTEALMEDLMDMTTPRRLESPSPRKQGWPRKS